MSISDKKISKFYPDLKPARRSKKEVNPQNSWLTKITGIEAYFLDKISKRKKIAKKTQHVATISNAVGIILIATAVATGSLSVPAFASGWALSLYIALYRMSVLLLQANSAS